MAAKKDNLIYIVEDNKVYNKLISGSLAKLNFTNLRSFFSGEECISAIKKGEKPDIIIQDYFLEKMNGIDVLISVKKISPNSEFIFLTSNESMEVAVNTIKFGAYDYIIKDKITLDKVVDRIYKIRKVKALEKRNKQILKYIILFSGVIFLIVLFALFFFVFNVFGTQ